MSPRIFSAAALLATLAQTAQVNVHNNCNFDVKALPSEGGADSPTPQVLKPGDIYSGNVDGSAMCLKLYGPGATQPTQLEWSTWNTGGKDVLSYDLSNIDMGADTTFLQHGMNLTSQDPTCDTKSSNCRPAICAAQGSGSTQPCKDAYNNPYDTRTLGASASYDLDMHLCTNDAGSEAHDAPDSRDTSNSAVQPAASSSQAAAPSQTTLATQASAPAPAPSSYTGGAVPVQADANGNVFEGQPQAEVVTTWVANTEVVTQIITARNAAPTLEKRYVHPHGHRGGHIRQ